MTTKPAIEPIWGDTSPLLTAPSSAKIHSGWAVEKPPVEYMNWLQNRFNEFLAHVNERGIPQWDSLTTYLEGALVFGSDFAIYRSRAGGNLNHDPASTLGYWTKFGGSGMWPTLQFPDLAGAGTTKLGRYNVAPGFAGNGDYVVLPYSPITALSYYNNAGALVWTKAHTDINGAATGWVGITYDSIDNLLYVVALDSTTTPDRFHTASINAAGTITTIGYAQPSVDFNNTPGWLTGGTVITVGNSVVQRVANGSGNLYVRAMTGTGLQEAEINIATGAFVVDPHTLSTVTGACLLYQTNDGAYIGNFQIPSTTTDIPLVDIRYGTRFVRSIIDSAYHNLVRVPDGIIPIQWGLYVVMTTMTASYTALAPGLTITSKALFDTWVGEVRAVLNL